MRVAPFPRQFLSRSEVNHDKIDVNLKKNASKRHHKGSVRRDRARMFATKDVIASPPK